MTQDPVTLVAALRNTLEDTGRDFSSMPFFVRPMVRGGFAKRTGQSLDRLAGLGGDGRLMSAPRWAPARRAR